MSTLDHLHPVMEKNKSILTHQKTLYLFYTSL